jgi:hypothetical protein
MPGKTLKWDNLGRLAEIDESENGPVSRPMPMTRSIDSSPRPPVG